MKNLGYLVLVLILSAALNAGCSSCRKKEGPKPAPATPAPAAGTTVKTQAGQTASALAADTVDKNVLTAEDYWKIQIERTEALKDLYEKLLAIYSQANGNSVEVQNKVNEINQQHQDKTRQIFTSRGPNAQLNLFPRGSARIQIQQERDKFLHDHADLLQRYQTATRETQELRMKLLKYKDKPGANMFMPPSPPPSAGPNPAAITPPGAATPPGTATPPVTITVPPPVPGTQPPGPPPGPGRPPAPGPFRPAPTPPPAPGAVNPTPPPPAPTPPAPAPGKPGPTTPANP